MAERMEKEKCWKSLDYLIRSKAFVELHTHLLGMGSADFWVNRIMWTYLPRVVRWKHDSSTIKGLDEHLIQHLKDQLEEPEKTVRDSIKLLFKSLGSPQIAGRFGCFKISEPLRGLSKDDFLELYTDDVVYHKDTILKLLGIAICDQGVDLIKRKYEDDQSLQCMQRIFGEHVEFKNYIVFNARERMFQIVSGISNSVICDLMENDGLKDKVESFLRNGFSLLRKDGKPAGIPDLETYRGNFTPEFYPRRFAMKDCIYGQRLEVLSILLNNVIHRYAKSGVLHVEFSLGVNDLCNLDVWKHLRPEAVFASSKTNLNVGNKRVSKTTGKSHKNRGKTMKLCQIGLKSKKQNPIWSNYLGCYKEKPRDFSYYFLAAFNRQGKPGVPLWIGDHNISTKEQAINFLLAENMDTQRCTETKSIEILYNCHLEKVKEILARLNENSNLNLAQEWAKSVVGLDWIGDEFAYPYCVFTHPLFIGEGGLVQEMMKFNKKFGIRVHCGESVPAGVAGERHMKILNAVLQKLWDAKINLRIGHGIAFLNSSTEAQSIMNGIKTNKTTCELNMTSNHYLIGNTESCLKKFLANRVKVILCTDDDGIWPIHKCRRHYDHVSIASEICEGIEQGFIGYDDLKDMVKNAANSVFVSVDNNVPKVLDNLDSFLKNKSIRLSS